LRIVLPNIAICDPDIGTIIQQRIQEGCFGDATSATSSTSGLNANHASQMGQDAQLRSMIESTGQLDLDKWGHSDFRGRSSEKVFARQIGEQLKDVLGAGQVLAKISRGPPMLAFNIPKSATEYPSDFGIPNTIGLPSREVAKALCSDALGCACCLLHFIHQPSFYKMFDRVYDTPAKHFGDDENRHLPLLYMMLALGCLFHAGPVDDTTPSEYSTCENRMGQGQVLFRRQPFTVFVYIDWTKPSPSLNNLAAPLAP
jgi:hypothetical protein